MTFYQMVLNNRKSIFEIIRKKNASFENNLKNRTFQNGPIYPLLYIKSPLRKERAFDDIGSEN